MFLSADDLLSLSIQLVNGFREQVVNAGLCQNDMSMDNVLVDLGPPIAVNFIDFGGATRQVDRAIDNTKYWYYTDPRRLKNDHQVPYSVETDLFSLSVIIAVLCGDTTFNECNEETSSERLLKLFSQYRGQGLWSTLPYVDTKTLSDSQELFKAMLSINVENRPDVHEVHNRLVNLRTQHRIAMDRKMKELTENRELKDIDNNMLLLILNSDYGSIWLAKYGWKMMIERLGSRILTLPDYVLQKLSKGAKPFVGDDLLFPLDDDDKILSMTKDMLQNYVELGGRFKLKHFQDLLLFKLDDHSEEVREKWLNIIKYVYQNLEVELSDNLACAITNRFVDKAYHFFIKPGRLYYHARTMNRIIKNHDEFEIHIQNAFKQLRDNLINNALQDTPVATRLLNRYHCYQEQIARNWTVEENAELEQINADFDDILNSQNPVSKMQLLSLFKNAANAPVREILKLLHWIAEDARLYTTSPYACNL